MIKRYTIIGLLLSFVSFSQSVRSQPEALPEIAKSPKVCFWETEQLPSPPLSQTEPSIPNLWLAQELYGYSTIQIRDNIENGEYEDDLDLEAREQRQKYQILETWFIETSKTQIEADLYVNNLVTLVVNQVNWRREKYMGQYVFLIRFGSVTREYGYNLRVCNRKGDLLAYYVCDFNTAPLDCKIDIISEGFRLRDFRNFNRDQE